MATVICIDDPDDVKSGLERAFRLEGHILVSVQTDPNAQAMPPRLEFDQMKGFALYIGKMMLSGRMNEDFRIIFSNYNHLGEILQFKNVSIVIRDFIIHVRSAVKNL